MTTLAGVAARHQPFALSLEDYNCFRPRVIYIDVKSTDGALQNLYLDLKGTWDKVLQITPDKRPAYRPHMTVAFKDLSRRMFYGAWEQFSGERFHAHWQVTMVALLKHQTAGWVIDSEYPLGEQL